ncbi:BTAD domain-containing putative transcriptional regulator [Ureibacillus acetophenoni]|uniref:Transcriptional regulator n=1 Tax=Ureibacillus acetophenoni TaxID=614649 RepID=A0A285UB94_9BACL|nr:BTAD domain-containing putative transcriptional regulator [Ureibacillus acetophenoni]SOC37591.1 transcriptional regulator [Ureibacillus acetophenoni]
MQNVLLSKIIPPDTSNHFMRRVGLAKKLSKISQAKLTILQSGAGYGKTSALTQITSDQNLLFSWYQVSDEDDDILPFMRHLFYSIQRVCDSFGTSLNGWDNLSMFPKLDELNKLYKMFVNEFYKIDTPLYIVIDDFHLVNHVFQINYVLNKIIENLPSHIHFIVATRQKLNWNCLFQLKMNGQLIECTEQDFAFSEEEIQVLFEDYFDCYLTITQVRKILDVTEGWAIAIILLALQLKDSDSTTSIDEITNLSLNEFFSYLSEEIFENMNSLQQDALLKFSIFPTFSFELIKQFYNETMAEQLKELLKIQGFIQHLNGQKEFRFHVLFQQFLEMKLKEKDEDEFTNLHVKAAQYFIDENKPMFALHHANKAKNELIIAEILVQFANFFINAGQFDYYLERIKELSDPIKADYYAIFFYEGECLRYKAQYEKAKKAYDQCLFYAEKLSDHYFILKTYAGIAHIYLDTIQPAFAEDYLEKALKIAERVNIEKEELYLLQRQYAENLVNLGKAYESEQWVKNMNLPEEVLYQGNLDVRTLLRQGKLNDAKMLIKLREAKEVLPLDAHRESDVLNSLILSMLGEIEESFVRANNCVINSERDFSQYAEAVAYLRRGHALLLLNPFEVKFAEQSYLKTIEIMDEIHVTRAKAESYMGLALVYSRNGNIDEGISYANLGLYETERVQDAWVSALLLATFTKINVENHSLTDALHYAKRAKELFSQCKDKYGQMVSSFWLSYIYFLKDDKDRFTLEFQQFVSICFNHQYEFFVQKITLLGPRNLLIFHQLLSYQLSIESNDDLKKLGQMIKYKEGVVVPRYFISVNLLGAFRIFRDYEEIDDKEWKREKAKELFLYLLLNKDRFVTKDELLHILWPNGNDVAMARDFKVIYNACLKVLEPERNAREESAYIIRKNSMYQLHPSISSSSDIEYFKKFASNGLAEKNPSLSIEWLQLSVSLYKGNLLEEFQHIEWLQQIRNELVNLYIQVIERIAQNLIRLKKFQDAVYWAEKLIQQDNTWEEGYRLLMLSYFQLNNRSQAVKWFEKCVEVLKNELNIEPMESTYEIYEMIVR